ncbi:MAG: VWA domain-containing protein [Bacteroidota bacterium]
MIPSLTNIHLVNPEFLVLLGLLPLLAFRYWVSRKQRFADLRMSSLGAFEGASSLKGRLRNALPILRALAFVALVVALARPQATLKEEEITADGIDIVLVTDVSSSMLARDFKPDRLEASKQVAIEFVEKREHDRVGLAVFAGEAFTQCPLTTDHKVIKEFLSTLKCGSLEDGTAIGLGLATAVNRLKDSEAKSKVVILLTDGVNNAGEYIMPLTAAEIAREFNVKVYTIGVGTTGDAYAPIGRRGDGEYVFGFVRVEIDEALLRQIADMTGGKYFRAVNKESLQNIYQEIDQLEKTKIDVTTIKRYSEEFYPWVFLGIFLLVLELFLRYTIFRTIP